MLTDLDHALIEIERLRAEIRRLRGEFSAKDFRDRVQARVLVSMDNGLHPAELVLRAEDWQAVRLAGLGGASGEFRDMEMEGLIVRPLGVGDFWIVGAN